MYAYGDTIDYTPVSAVVAGAVVVVGSHPLIATNAIAAAALGALTCKGVAKVPQKAEVFTAGDAVYWDVDGTPVTGDATSGAATGTASAGYLMGWATKTTEATDTYVEVDLRGITSVATIGGAVTATDLEAEDASLGINGIDAAQGGAIVATGGTSSTTGNAGGAVSLVGGTPGATGAGGAASVTGGIGGATSGNGGAVSLVGGAATNGNGNGGAVTINGGAKNGSGTDGAIVIGSTAASITFGKMPRIPVPAAVAVGGTAIGNANAVGEGFQVVTGADDTAAVILPTAVAGAQVIIKSTTAAKNLIVFPAVGAQINNVGANNAYNMVADEGCSMFIAYNATQWYTLPLVSS
jgi:predicted RecA/RadA family phage recombinase